MAILIIAIILIVLFIVWCKSYKLKFDTVVLFTGGNGSGKSLLSCKTAIKLLKKNRRKRIFKNLKKFFTFNRDYIPKPYLYSNIPVRISRKEWSKKLTNDYLMLDNRLPELSVVFIDEINLLISQMDYKFKGDKILNNFVTLYRHYTKGGYLVMNTQNVNKVHWVFRYCANFSFNLSCCKSFILPFIKRIECRKISVGDDIKTVDTDDAGETMRTIWCTTLGKKYDTHCYSDLYPPQVTTIINHSKYKAEEFETLLDYKK